MATIKYKERFNKNFFEEAAWLKNQVICGIDEVGRGCLAGPVVTASVILYPGKTNKIIKDSKLLTQDELLAAYKWLLPRCWYNVALISNRQIDRYNIYYATLRAMKRSVLQLFTHCPLKPSKILTDAMPLDLGGTAYEPIDVVYFSSGERKSSSIAAASIIAKVTRDALMRKLDPLFPHYQFARHKGYSTKIHQQAVHDYQRSLLHRIRFLNFLSEQTENQQTIETIVELSS